MQKDFKIGLAIGVTLAVGAVIWLSTLPKLSTRARALEAASQANQSSKPPPYVTSPQNFPVSEVRDTANEPQAAADQTQIAGGETQAANNEIRDTNDGTQTRIHVVQKGDTLSSISAKYYGSARQWRKIVNANRTNLPDPNHLIPGSKLLIP